ncbi:MAG: hypothetical protein GY941_17220, partial [Planctomycetes bacterium]|nr:hypothetical protein [Planctomycetota bacterium]
MKKVLIMLSCILFKKAINSSPRFLYLPSVFIPIFINFVFILLVDCAYVQAAVCVLDAKFEPATLSDGMEYYTDRAYTLTSVPSQYVGLDMIKTPNDDRALTDASGGYITFELLNNATVFVAFDNRATSLPDWMSGFADTGDAIYTSLSTQQFLKVYSKNFISGDCINLGANQAAGFSGGIVSNYVVFYRAAAACVLDVKFQETILSDGMEYYTDRVYTFTNVPVQYIGLDMIKTPNDDRNLTAASDYLAFELQNDVTVYVAYDRRATSLPDWLNGFADTGDIINTSLGTQQFLKVYSKNFISG